MPDRIRISLGKVNVFKHVTLRHVYSLVIILLISFAMSLFVIWKFGYPVPFRQVIPPSPSLSDITELQNQLELLQRSIDDKDEQIDEALKLTRDDLNYDLDRMRNEINILLDAWKELPLSRLKSVEAMYDVLQKELNSNRQLITIFFLGITVLVSVLAIIVLVQKKKADS